MTNETKPQQPAAPAASPTPPTTTTPKATTDLSRAIDGAVERAAGEEVRSVRVFDDNYRCNWWVRDATPGPVYLNTGRIIKSKFLRATMKGEQLVLEDLSSARPRD